MSNYLQIIEVKILEEAVKYLGGNDLILCHDGCMMRMSKFKNLDLSALNGHIKSRLNMDIEFINKPMNEGEEVSDILIEQGIDDKIMPSREDYIMMMTNADESFDINYFLTLNSLKNESEIT